MESFRFFKDVILWLKHIYQMKGPQINDTPQAIKCELLLYADDISLIFKHSNFKEKEIQLIKSFSLICDWSVDNKLRIHFGEDKTKLVLFSSKNEIKEASPLNI